MAILTVADLKLIFDADRIQQLASDTTKQFGVVKYNEVIVQTMITQAEGTVKNMLGLQYTVAQLEADAGIKRIVADLTMYYLESRRPPVPTQTESVYKVAMHLLEQLQKGDAKLADVQQLLPIGSTTIPTEAISTGFFNLTEAEEDSLKQI